MLEVLLGGNLLEPVGPAEQGVEGMKLSGTNSVTPRVRSWSSRTTPCAGPAPAAPRHVRTSPSTSTSAARWEASMISTQRAAGSLFGEIRWRTPSSRTSAAVPGVDPSPQSIRYSKTSSRRLPGLLAHVVDLHRRIRVEVDGPAQLPWRAAAIAPYVSRVPRSGWIPPRLGAELRSLRIRSLPSTRADELLFGGFHRRRAISLPWPKPQNAQPTTQMLVKLMLPQVDDEGGRVTRQFVPDTIGRYPHLLDDIGPGFGKKGSQFIFSEGDPLPAFGDRPVGAEARSRVSSSEMRPEPRTRNEAPVLQFDHVEYALLHPVGVHVLRIDAKAFGQGETLGRKFLP